jgi:hypothetical protein
MHQKLQESRSRRKWLAMQQQAKQPCWQKRCRKRLQSRRHRPLQQSTVSQQPQQQPRQKPKMYQQSLQ